MYKKLLSIIAYLYYKISKRKRIKFNRELTIEEISNEYNTKNLQYDYFHHYFWNIAPEWLREHRSFFIKENRGFGEDAFHAMWYLLFKEYRPIFILEIGVYRGQTLTLFSLLSKKLDIESSIHGISPFTSIGDSVSKYLNEIDFYEDVKNNFKFFHLELPIMHKGLSTDKNIIKIIQPLKFDLIYIDGNHDYDVVKQDFTIYSNLLNRNGLIVLDDASLNTEYKPKAFYSSAGHPGPSQVASEIDDLKFKEILSVGHNRIYKKIIVYCYSKY